MKNRPSQWFTALCCRSSLSTHWNVSSPPLFMHIFQLSSGINITTKGLLYSTCGLLFSTLKGLSKCRYSYEIIHWFEYNDSKKRYLCSLQSDWHISTFWLAIDQISTLRLRDSKSQETTLLYDAIRSATQTSFHMLNLCYNYTSIWQWLREQVCVLSDIMHCGGWLILLHPAIYFSGKEGFHKASAKQRQWEESLEEILETDTLKCRVSHWQKNQKRSFKLQRNNCPVWPHVL